MPEITWGFSDSIWGLIGGLLLVVIVPPLLVLPFDPNIGDPDKASDVAILATQTLFDAFLIAVAIGIASGWRFNLRQALGRLGLRGFQPSAIGWMFAVLGTYYVGAIAFSAIVLQPKQEDIGKELGVCNPGIGIAIFAVLAIIVLAPIAEEIFFRGFFFAGLRTRWSLWPSALLSGAIFGLVHAPTGPNRGDPARRPRRGTGMALQQDRIDLPEHARPLPEQCDRDQRGAGPMLSDEQPPAVSAHGLAKSYGDRVAVAGIDFEVEPGHLLRLPRPERRRQDDDDEDDLRPRDGRRR